MEFSKLKKLLSYLWPFTRRYTSEISGVLEVTYINGKKVLDSENANYSYGKLQKVLELGLRQIDLSPVKNTLVLGLGGGSVVESLREKFGYTEQIIAVDVDGEVIRIAQEEFAIKETEKLKIIHEDAFAFIKDTQENFQLVIIDLFIDTKIPSLFLSQEFCSNISRILEKNGFFIFNMGISVAETLEIEAALLFNFANDFSFLEKPKGLEVLLIGKKLQ